MSTVPFDTSSTGSEPGIDPSIQHLVDALNAFAGIHTIGSCGGHPEPLRGGQWPAGSWYVKFRVDKDAYGWRALEFLAWLINNAYQRAEHHVTLYPTAPPPYLNAPGRVLAFALEGYDGEDPNQLAEWMDQLRTRAYIPPAQSRSAVRQASVRQPRRRRPVAEEQTHS
jgi:hypothetical protein